MTAIRINDIKRFMELLLSGDTFDGFCFIEAEVGMAMNITVSGRINKAFLTQEETELLGSAAFHTWGAAKETVRRLVSGKRLPVGMKIVIQKDAGTGTQILNIRFDRNGLLVITGFAEKGFSPDKQPEKDWDDEAFGFLKNLGLDPEIC